MSATVSACYYYPLKSGAAIEADSLELEQSGPKYDRKWMLVDADGKFMSQREKGNEKLALVRPKIIDTKHLHIPSGFIGFNAPKMSELTLSQKPLGNAPVEATVHGNPCTGYEASQEASAWFSDYLGKKCCLISYAEDHPRLVDPDYSNEGDTVGFADGMPLLVASTSSLGALAQHFPDNININMNRFRPNIVIDGLDAFEEDVIHFIKIGDTRLEFVKPCTRCILTTVNQNTGQKNTGNEPMGTLAKTRFGSADGLKGAFFGQNAIPRNLGTIKVGQKVEILATKPMHPALMGAQLRHGQ